MVKSFGAIPSAFVRTVIDSSSLPSIARTVPKLDRNWASRGCISTAMRSSLSAIGKLPARANSKPRSAWAAAFARSSAASIIPDRHIRIRHNPVLTSLPQGASRIPCPRTRLRVGTKPRTLVRKRCTDDVAVMKRARKFLSPQVILTGCSGITIVPKWCPIVVLRQENTEIFCGRCYLIVFVETDCRISNELVKVVFQLAERCGHFH